MAVVKYSLKRVWRQMLNTNLYIDIGNTHVKFAKIAEDGSFVFSRLQRECWVKSLKTSEWQPEGDISRIWMASVGQPQEIDKLKTYLSQHPQIKLHQFKTEKNWNGLSCAYPQPEYMGVDRWMVMIAAWFSCKQASLVVDCGTAATVDAIDSDGKHMGGHILPGLAMMRQSLLRHTTKVAEDYSAMENEETHWGQATTECVNNGVNSMLVAYIKNRWSEFNKIFPKGRLYITGGDGLVLSKMLNMQQDYVPDLLFKGMRIRSEGLHYA